MNDRTHPRIRTVSWREGRITRAQTRALNELLPRYRVPDTPLAIDFSDLFPFADTIAVEIGFGSGAMLLEMASANPNTGYLGIDIYRPGIGRLLLGLEKLDLANVRIANQDARDVLHERIAPGSVDELYLMFPDPWPKARHFKRRLIQPEFAGACADRLSDAGRLYFATDWADYASHCLEVLESTAGLRNAAQSGFAERPPRIATGFEQRAAREDREIFDLIFEKAGASP